MELNGKLEKDVEGRLNAWLAEQLADADQVKVPELAREAVEHFSQDQELVHELMLAVFYPVVYERARRIIGRGRGGAIAFADGMVQSHESFEEEAAKPRILFDKWYEHTPAGHVKFKSLTRPLAIAAAAERFDRASGEFTKGVMLSKVSAHLEDDTQVVGAVLVDEELAELWEESVKEADSVARNLLPG